MHYLLHILRDHLLLLIITGLSSVTLYAVSPIVEAYLDFKKRPKEPMLWCHKHGAFRKKHALPLFPDLDIEGSFVCPECYRQAVFVKPNEKLKV